MILCVDTGGTKTLVAAFSHTGEPVGEHRFPTPKDQNDYVRILSRLIRHEYNLHDIDSIALGIPGEVRHNIVEWCTNLPWKNFALPKALGAQLEFIKPIYMDNDANLAALAEAHALHPMPASVMYVTISTGIGMGLIINGRIAPALKVSEAGHMVVEYKGNVIEWERLTSGRALYEEFGKYARDITDESTWHEIAQRISRGLLDLIPMLQPDVVVIGGSIGSYFDRYAAPLREAVDHGLYAHLKRPEIRQAHHPEEAVLYGGYVYATL